MTIDTNKLRELAQNATPGPWPQWVGHGWVMAGTPEANEKGYMAGTDGQVCRTDCDDFSDAQEIKNAEYIAAASPAIVLSTIKRRSNSASAANTWNTRRPAAVLVSMRSVVLSKPTPAASSSPTILTSSGSDRPIRSSRLAIPRCNTSGKKPANWLM